MSRADVERLTDAKERGGLLAVGIGGDPRTVLQQVCRTAGLPGSVLPTVRVYGAVVRPVVVWDLNVLAARVRSARGPILHRVGVREVVEGSGSVATAAVLRLSGVLSCGSFQPSRPGLAALACYGRVIVAAATPPGPDFWDAAECDYRGYTVIEVSGQGAAVAVQGHLGADPGTRAVAVQERLLTEQLFDVAERSGLVPPI